MSDAPVKFFSLHQYHNKSGSVAAEAAFRRVILTWKTTAKDHAMRANHKIESRFIDLPTFKVVVQPDVLAQAMQAAYEGFEDGLVRQLVMAKYNWKDGKHEKLQLSSDELAVSKVAEYAAASGLGRLSADAIQVWFDSVALLPISMEVARKRGIDDVTTDGVVDAVGRLRTAIAACASTKLAMPVKTAEALLRALGVVEDAVDDADADHMLAKLKAVVIPFAKPDETVADLI
jgi:hypothetical protein